MINRAQKDFININMESKMCNESKIARDGVSIV